MSRIQELYERIYCSNISKEEREKLIEMHKKDMPEINEILRNDSIYG
jgi:hypothetical protein